MGLIFFDRFKDGHGLTLNSKLSPEDLKKGIKLEEHVSVYEDFLKTTGDGTYGYMGEFASGHGFTAPKARAQAEQAARVRARMQAGEPPLLLGIDPKTGMKAFYDEDQDAFEQGWICSNCVQYQAVPNAPQCNWMNKPDDGCGHLNDNLIH